MIRFEALEYDAEARVAPARFEFSGDAAAGWHIRRNGHDHLQLGPGYRALRSRACGVCATDLARRWLPFPLPQVIGHEVIAEDERGRPHVIEINASHHARGVDECAFCRAGLDTHCPDRLVLGIHDLPGGFGPWILAPVQAALPVPASLPASTAVLVEPFAAALHAVETVDLRQGDRVLVLGPRRLGTLVLAALRALSDRDGLSLHLLAAARRRAPLELATSVGAAEGILVEGEGAGLPAGLADVVIDTTGNPAALPLALRLARRELHLKSTHGRPVAGLRHVTEMVVDELGFAPLRPNALPAPRPGAPRRVAWLAPGSPPSWLDDAAEVLRDDAAAAMLDRLERTAGDVVPRADAAVVADALHADAVIRPVPGREVSLLRPRGRILVTAPAGRSAVLDAVATRDLVVSTSRCGSFARALALLDSDHGLRGLGDRLVTHRFSAARLADALATAASPACTKAIVEHG